MFASELIVNALKYFAI